MMKRDEYLAQVINVYRTRNYIVFQQVGICDDAEEGTFLYSYDSYYRRTAKNNREYETVDELKMQNSYFINSLYGNAGNGSA